MIKPSTLHFLTDLAENNHKPWLDANKKIYSTAKQNCLDLTSALLSEMQKFDAGLEPLQPKDCMFRINRDIRFSADKSPYKSHFGIAMHIGGKKSGLAAYYLHIEPEKSFVGGGVWMPEAPALKKIRKEIHYFPKEWTSILNNPDFIRVYNTPDEESGAKLSRPPKGFDAEDPMIEWIKLKSFTATRPVSNEQLCSEKALPIVIDAWKSLKPMLQFLNSGMLSDEEGGL
ncbi:MAG: DUF2461 domain-containing protein [Saprospiraceae bacterium]|jgi:uncharacterized protein (TIGR02453 family)|nr:DUF2461 domain-containing protein [Saprospiraceae bacterium]